VLPRELPDGQPLEQRRPPGALWRQPRDERGGQAGAQRRRVLAGAPGGGVGRLVLARAGPAPFVAPDPDPPPVGQSWAIWSMQMVTASTSAWFSLGAMSMP